MSGPLIMAPLPIAAIVANRGVGAANLLTPSPKEVWADTVAAGDVGIDIDLGAVRSVDTILLGFLSNANPATNIAIQGGTAGYTETMLENVRPLRAVDAAGQFAEPSHCLWTGAAVNVRYIRLYIANLVGQPLSAGVVMVGRAFRPTFNQEWGAGRRVIDVGSATPLPDGGWATVPGGRRGSYVMTLGDLSDAEVDALYAIQLAVGETMPALVVENPAATAGQFHRIHYGLLRSLRQFERRTPGRTRWELTIEQWT